MKLKKISLAAITILLPACSNLNNVSLDTVSNVGNISSPKIGDVNVTQALDAAKELKDAAMVSEEEIAKMAFGFAKHSDSKNKIAAPGSSYVNRMNKIVAKHKSEDGLNLNFKVYLSKEVNAFALADGSIRVYSGLMDLMNDDELLAVIGHEIGHVKLGHSAESIRLAHLAAGVKKGVASTSNVAGALADDALLGGLFEKVINSQFSQSQETESDEYSVGFFKKHGYNLNAEISAFNKLASMEEESSLGDSILASHPASAERAKHIEEIIGSDSNIKVVAVAKKDSSEQQDTKQEKLASNDTNHNTSKPDLSARSVHGKSAALGKKSMIAESSSLPSGWYVQVAAKPEIGSAKMLEEELSKFGFSALQQEAVVNGKKYHRVIVGPFSQKNKADQTKQQVIESSITKEEPFVRLIK